MNQLVQDAKLRLEVPVAMVGVLQACFGGGKSLTVDSVVTLTSKLSIDQASLPEMGVDAANAALFPADKNVPVMNRRGGHVLVRAAVG